MLDVIATRGLPLDRIVTSDVWATDTIPASLPPVTAFKEEMDGFILERYGINVEHLCAVDADGNKQTYEKLFYHVPKRRERERELDTSARQHLRISDDLCTLVPNSTQTLQPSRGSRSSRGAGASISSGDITGFPISIRHKMDWCKKLKQRVFVKPCHEGR